MKIAHESPNSIFKIVQELTDYDYCLVHLLDEDMEYLENFKRAKKLGREIILDNSIFELGEAFNHERFAHWVREIEPDWYIVPDFLEGKEETIRNYMEFMGTYSSLPGKPIGVVQGKNYQELADCYKYYASIEKIAMIAISFDYSYYESLYPTLSKPEAWCNGRRTLLFKLMKEKFFNPNIPIHLLGCSLPQEFEFYSDLDFIYSVDTSNPVVHGLLGIPYKDYGLRTKESVKLFTLIGSQVDEQQTSLITDNILKFRQFCN
jgi:hypothetical protein